MVRKKKAPYGRIYLANNIHDGKNYIGKAKNIEKRGNKHLNDARALNRAREANPDHKISGTHFDNALAKYGPDAFNVTQEDVAYSKKELNELERDYVKEYDSMNPEKGYNMTEGGDGGRLSPEAMEKLRETMNSPEYKEKMSEKITEKWQENEYREKQIQQRTKTWQDPEYRKILWLYL